MKKSEVDHILRAAGRITGERQSHTAWLNAIGQDSKFHEQFGYYADPVDEASATLPKGWKGRLVNLPSGDTEGVSGLCLDPHDLAIAKYAACREKDLIFMRGLISHGIVARDRLEMLLEKTHLPQEKREQMRQQIARDFGASK